jgi:type VI secretion system secreted protein VgrG
MASNPVYLTGGATTSPNRTPAVKVLAGALANNRVANSLVSALGENTINMIVATSTSSTTNFGGLQVGDYVVHIPLASGPPTSLLGAAATYAALGYSAVTGSTGGGSTLTGNIGVYPATGTSITNFPPSTYSGTENAGNAAAQAAQAAAQAAYTYLQGLTPSGTNGGMINSELGGQSLAAGVYVATSGTAGTFTLNGTLTLTGSATDVYVFQTASTLVTGGTSTPVISLGSVLPSNIYWAVGSSATINSAHSGTFDGSVIAQASITDTLGGTVNGSLVALTGAVTYSATTTSISAASGGGSGAQASFSTVVTAGTLPTAAVVGDLYIDLTPVNLDANNPLIPPPPAQLTGRKTGNGGLEF